MLSKEENELLTRVGRGTPGGEMLRRYWWPVGFSELVSKNGQPAKARLLGEDLVLFRDGGGQARGPCAALLAPRHVTRVRPGGRDWYSLLLPRLALRHPWAMSRTARGTGRQ